MVVTKTALPSILLLGLVSWEPYFFWYSHIDCQPFFTHAFFNIFAISLYKLMFCITEQFCCALGDFSGGYSFQT